MRGAGERLRARPGLRATLYLASSDEKDDLVPATGRLAEALRTSAPAGVRWQHRPRPDLRHDNIYRSLAPSVLRELFAPAAPAR